MAESQAIHAAFGRPAHFVSERVRVFVDSNVLLSASLDSPNQFEEYWNIPSVEILTSQYSIEEVSRNLRNSEHRAHLWRLIYSSHLVPAGEDVTLDDSISLPAKDQSILRSAIAGSAAMLVTGDRNHFGKYFGIELQGVLIIQPHRFRRRFSKHLQVGKKNG